MADDTTGNDAGPVSSRQGAKGRDPDNTISPFRRRTRESAQREDPEPQKPTADAGAQPRKPDPRSRAVPDHILKRFVKVDQRFYFPDGAHAFTDRGSRLTTKSDNTEVVQSLIEIAEARGWKGITVTGTERFRRQAWAAATAAGLTVRGYVPSELDRASAARQRTSEKASPSEVTSPAAAAAPARSRDPVPRRSDAPIRGRLVEYGPAPYRHDPHEGMSYFVRVQTREGEREVWGVDLERALKQSVSRPERGDEVGLRLARREHVTVQTATRDREGKVIGKAPLDTHRNHWIIERGEFFDARAAAARTLRDPGVDPKQGARQHPELIGTYLQIHAAEIAARQLRDPEDRVKFVNRVRAVLADAIARGEALPAVRLKERSATPSPPQREEAPAR